MKLKSWEFISLSACTMVLTALGIDIMLPAFAAIREDFGLGDATGETAKIITWFFMGQVTQVIFGLLSDRYGRLPILRAGFPLYILGGVAAAFAPSLTSMFAARFVAGMGASAVFMSTIAGVRDRYSGDKMASILSLIFTIFLFTPVLAPFLGEAILAISNWQMVLLTPAVFAMLVFVWSFRLDESLPVHKRSTEPWGRAVSAITIVLRNRSFLRYTAITTFLFSGLSAYVAHSERLIGVVYRRPELFAWIFGGMGLLMAGFTLLNSRLAARFGAARTLRLLLVVFHVISFSLLVITLLTTDPPAMPLFFGCISLLLSLNLAIEPNSSSLALEPMGKMAGVASSVYGTCFFFIGSFAGSLVTGHMGNGVLPLVYWFAVIGLFSLLLAFTGNKNTGGTDPGGK